MSESFHLVLFRLGSLDHGEADCAVIAVLDGFGVLGDADIDIPDREFGQSECDGGCCSIRWIAATNDPRSRSDNSPGGS